MKAPLTPGLRVYRYLCTGAAHGYETSDLQTLTIVRVNRKSVTVRTDHGGQFRMHPADIDGLVDWE